MSFDVGNVGRLTQEQSAMAFEPFAEYLTSSKSTANDSPKGLVTEVMRDIASAMADNINSNRVFIPCLITCAKIFQSHILKGELENTTKRYVNSILPLIYWRQS